MANQTHMQHSSRTRQRARSTSSWRRAHSRAVDTNNTGAATASAHAQAGVGNAHTHEQLTTRTPRQQSAARTLESSWQRTRSGNRWQRAHARDSSQQQASHSLAHSAPQRQQYKPHPTQDKCKQATQTAQATVHNTHSATPHSPCTHPSLPQLDPPRPTSCAIHPAMPVPPMPVAAAADASRRRRRCQYRPAVKVSTCNNLSPILTSTCRQMRPAWHLLKTVQGWLLSSMNENMPWVPHPVAGCHLQQQNAPPETHKQRHHTHHEQVLPAVCHTGMHPQQRHRRAHARTRHLR
jgi:hypothetical protein